MDSEVDPGKPDECRDAQAEPEGEPAGTSGAGEDEREGQCEGDGESGVAAGVAVVAGLDDDGEHALGWGSGPAHDLFDDGGAEPACTAHRHEYECCDPFALDDEPTADDQKNTDRADRAERDVDDDGEHSESVCAGLAYGSVDGEIERGVGDSHESAAETDGEQGYGQQQESPGARSREQCCGSTGLGWHWRHLLDVVGELQNSNVTIVTFESAACCGRGRGTLRMTEVDLDTRLAPAPPWHSMTNDAVFDALDATAVGLSGKERQARLRRFGPNLPRGRKREPWWKEVLESLLEPMQLLLIGVAVLSGVFGSLADALAIGALVLVVVGLESISEIRASRSVDALRAMSAPTARVLGPSGVQTRPAAEVVPGDVILVEAGDIVPADARLLAGVNGVRLDESGLTGESQSVGKASEATEAGAPLAERHSMLFAGTAVVAGDAMAVVVSTGVGSELGRMGKLVAETKEQPTPLQKGLAQLARVVLVFAIAASVLVPVIGVLAGQPWKDMLLTGLTVAFATVPEELPILIAVLLAVGGRQLARRGALLRKLRAGETLGQVTTVVTDKTGTLTENRLRFEGIAGDQAQVLTVALHTQSVEASDREPMDVQLREQATATGIHHDGQEAFAYPFDSTRKLVSRGWVTAEGRAWVAVSGAPEAVIANAAMSDEERGAALDATAALADDGLRVIAFGRRFLDGVTDFRPEAVETGLEFVGLASFRDSLRAGVSESVAALTAAGVGTIVVTGDHPRTARAIALQAGLSGEVISGPEFDRLPDDLARHPLQPGTVIARATPATKHRIVQLLQRDHQIVAVTGDGPNDAPALAAADVGIAMGRRGSDLARETAGVVLTDDSYPTVVAAIAKGRNISAQLRRAVAFYLGAKLALVIILVAALALGLPSPFGPAQIVLLEIFMDIGASLAFVNEPSAPQAMHRPPRNPQARFMDWPMVSSLLTVAVTLVIAVLPTYLLLGEAGADIARSGAVLAWLVGHALVAWTLRSRPRLSWKANAAFPIWAAAAILVGLLLVLTPLGQIVHLVTLSVSALLTALSCTVIGCIVATLLRLFLPSSSRL